MFQKDIYEFLRCVECMGELYKDENSLKCSNCGHNYQLFEEIPYMMPTDLSDDIKRNIAYWNNLDLEYDAYSRGLSSSYLELIDKPLISHVKGRVLEIGCGTARLQEEVENQGSIYVGLDPSIDLIKKAYLDGREGLVIGIGEYLPFSRESFDCIIGGYYSFRSIMLEDCFEECHRVLKSNGILAFSLVNYWYLLASILVRNIRNLRKTWVKLPPFNPDGIYNDVKFYRTISSLLEKHGFNRISIQGTKVIPFTNYRFNYYNNPINSLWAQDVIFIFKKR